MKKNIFLLPVLFLLCTSQLVSQSNFNLEAYKQFLRNNQNMPASQLLEMHSAGTFKSNLNVNYPSALYFDSIDYKYNLTQSEKRYH